MTAYTATFTNWPAVSAGISLGVIAGTYPCRIARIEITCGFGAFYEVLNYSGAAFSGGTTVTPLPLRGGAPATTATAKSSMTMTGTATLITAPHVGTTQVSGTTTTGVPETLAYDFPFDYIIPTGSGIYVTNLPFNSSTSPTINSLAIYYEELRLSWSF